jgi:hypothetical protein
LFGLSFKLSGYVSLNIEILLTFIHAMQNGQNLGQLLIRPLPIFGGNGQKKF